MNASALLKQWQAIPWKQRVAILNLAALAVLFLGYQNVLRPQSAKLKKLRVESKSLGAQMETVSRELPNLEREKEEFTRQAQKLAQFQQELNSVESHLPAGAELGRLVGALVDQGEGLGISFDAVKQHEEKDQELPEVGIEITFEASYEDLVNYMRRVEQLTPFLKVVRFEVISPQEPKGNRVQTKLTLRTPLRLSPEAAGQSLILGTPPSDRIFLQRSPFVVKKPVSEERDREIMVSGITFRPDPKSSTAIVNNQIMRVGDRMDDLEITQISPGEVTFSDGQETFAVLLGSGK